jgi:putative oxidoreductase
MIEVEAWHAWGTAILRVTLGAIYVTHGWLAAFVIGPEGMGGYITRMAYPPAAAPLLTWYLIVVHLVGGVLIIVGLFTRPAAIAQVPIMASALFLLHWNQGFFMKESGGYEYSLLVLASTLALALLGPGAASVDHKRSLGPRIPMP